MRIHELKILDHYFEDVISGRKTFEIRRNDRDYHVGDLLALNEIATPEDASCCDQSVYTGRSCIVKVNYLLDAPHLLQHDYVVLGIRPCRVGRPAFGTPNHLFGDEEQAYCVPVCDV